MTDPKGALLRIASQAREAEIVREAVELHGPDVLERVASIYPRRTLVEMVAVDVLACLVALCNGEQWPPKEEK